MSHSSLIRSYEIPDKTRPIPEDERGMCGPSAELIPFKPDRLEAENVIGRRVDEVTCHIGTYGMGGTGFFGMRLDSEWLTIAIHGAGNWITVDGLLVEDTFFDDYARPEPWINEAGDRLSPVLVGSRIVAIDVTARAMHMTFSNGSSLDIKEAADYRPIFQGTKQPRLFVSGDDLCDVVFLSPTSEIWVE
ncbi:hypothetical protein ATO10_02745 [Actibacterium atlanticum]|uniref:Uncharacterized protein n=1 Tax=Actibacterium atlanticum TaxID=1461693 RepID=A0A058ZQ02_9RHOB|nr:hypothetical protein [Actibacterium atlanticum]KCV83643.1 hypothetical protein ATO10_02745 [Actibacterium atlanticum]